MQRRNAPKWVFFISLIAAIPFLPGAVGKDYGDKEKKVNRGQMKFRGLDSNNDGRISRAEWRGNDRSFTAHDRNGDGILSGTEVTGALEAERYDDFAQLDRNRDGELSRNEWNWERSEYDRLDGNRDGSLSRYEYGSTTGTGVDAPGTYFPPATQAPTAPVVRDRYTRFNQLDRNGNGHISREEWDGDKKSFNALDDNNNDALSRDEFLQATPTQRKATFKQYDKNNNGVISKSEWTGDKQAFSRLDMNNDGKLGREEFVTRYRGLENNFSEMDRDHNGVLSREEFKGEKSNFDRLDDNRDGVLSIEEFVGVGSLT